MAENEPDKDGDGDFGDAAVGESVEELDAEAEVVEAVGVAIGVGDSEHFFGSERNARILRDDDCREVVFRSYSSMRFNKSSSDVIVTSASRSSVGN